MAHNNEYVQSDETSEIDDAVVNMSLVNDTNGFNNNFIDNIIKNGECNDYSNFEDLLNIDNFITQTENKDEVGQCNEYHNARTNFGVDSNVLSLLQVDLAFSRENATIPGDDNIHSRSKGCITACNESTTSNVNFNRENFIAVPVIDVDDQCNEAINASENPTNNNLNASTSSDVSRALSESDSVVQADSKIDGRSNGSIDSDANSINANVHIVNSEASSSLIQNLHLNAIEPKNDTPTAPVAKSTKTPKGRKKHFPQFIKLYCAKCGESPWTSRYYTDQKCLTCENNAVLRCSECNQESDRYENIVYHLKTKCAPNNLRYRCSQCNYNTFVRYSFKQHLKTHEPSSDTKCSDCGISVKNNRSLENHKRYGCPNRQHERDFKCPNCGKGYTNEMYVRKHEKNCFYAQTWKKAP